MHLVYSYLCHLCFHFPVLLADKPPIACFLRGQSYLPCYILLIHFYDKVRRLNELPSLLVLWNLTCGCWLGNLFLASYSNAAWRWIFTPTYIHTGAFAKTDKLDEMLNVTDSKGGTYLCSFLKYWLSYTGRSFERLQRITEMCIDFGGGLLLHLLHAFCFVLFSINR